MQTPQRARFRMSAVLAGLVATLTAAGVSASRAKPSVSIEAGIFKMLDLGPGGKVPASGPIIKVPYDKLQRRYLHVDQKPLELRATVIVSCANMTLQELTMATLGRKFPVTASGLSNLGGGVFTGTKTFTTSTLSTAALSSLVPDPVAICNADLDAFVKQGKHGTAQKGWTRKYDSMFAAEFGALCKGKTTKKGGFEEPAPIATPADSARFPVWIHCGPAAVFKTADNKPNVPVKKSGFQSARVFVNPPANANYRGSCPKELAFGGEIEFLKGQGTAPVEVSYRYRTHDGATSPVLTTTFTQSDRKNVTYWKHEFGGGSPSGGFAAPAGGAGKRVIDGGIRLEVLGGNGEVVGQDNATFKLTCEPTRVSAPHPGAATSALPDGSVKANKPASTGDTPMRTRSPAVGGFTTPASLPDLVIKSAQPAPTSPTTLRIEVANIGGAASHATTVAVFYTRSGHVVKKSFNVPAVGPGQSRWIVADLGSPLAHAERLTARVNDSGGSKESDPSNNTMTIK